MTIEKGAAQVIARLCAAGYKAYVVGGCVRDSLLGKTPQDWDICSSARPEQMIAVFGEENTIPTGLQHGTVTVRMDGGLYEVTTFRTEGAYSDGRHPDGVDFIDDVQEDLRRRDFTINAIAYHPQEGLIDPFGGREDLLIHRVVRAVGEPMRRFEEDALRILRLFRFAAREELHIDGATLEAALELSGNLSRVSAERIREELCKLLDAKRPGAYMPQAVLAVCIPEMSEMSEAAYRRVLEEIDAAPADRILRLALLVQGQRDCEGILRRLRLDNETIRVVSQLAEHMELAPHENLRVQARRLLGGIGMAQIARLVQLRAAQRACGSAKADLAPLFAATQKAQMDGDCCTVRELAVSGRDIMSALHAAPGPRMGRLLEHMLEAVIEDKVVNERDALLAWAQRHA